MSVDTGVKAGEGGSNQLSQKLQRIQIRQMEGMSLGWDHEYGMYKVLDDF